MKYTAAVTIKILIKINADIFLLSVFIFIKIKFINQNINIF